MPLNTETVTGASLHKKPVFTVAAEPVFLFQLNYLISLQSLKVLTIRFQTGLMSSKNTSQHTIKFYS